MSIRELFERGEDLSPDRFQANSKLRASLITHHRLLPEAFNAYPLSGLYYPQDSANRMYLFQISTFLLLYGILFLVISFITMKVIHRFRSRMKNITVLTSTGGILAFLAKSHYSGFYMTSAVGLVCCLGVLLGIALNQYRRP